MLEPSWTQVVLKFSEEKATMRMILDRVDQELDHLSKDIQWGAADLVLQDQLTELGAYLTNARRQLS